MDGESGRGEIQRSSPRARRRAVLVVLLGAAAGATALVAIEAASRAPNGGNRQPARFLLVTDREMLQGFGVLYHEAWWAKRKDEYGWTKPEDIPEEHANYRSAARLAAEIRDAPAVVLALAVPPGAANSVLPAVQNLMLAARALGIGSVPTTLHPTVMDRFNKLFNVPSNAQFHFCIPLGYPKGNFGSTSRKPTAEVTYLDSWDQPVPWA